MHDLVIRNGTMMDGTGGEPYEGDIAITAGKIVDVGPSIGVGREELDASDRLVTRALLICTPILMPRLVGIPCSHLCPGTV